LSPRFVFISAKPELGHQSNGDDDAIILLWCWPTPPTEAGQPPGLGQAILLKTRN
jgi:hypothetical protein